MVSAAIAVYFYLRVVLLMFGERPGAAGAVDEPPGEFGAGAGSVQTLVAATRVELDSWVLSGLGIVVLVTLFFGIWPQPLVSFAHDATFLVN